MARPRPSRHVSSQRSFLRPEFSRFSSAPFGPGFPSPARLANTDNQKRSIFSTNEGEPLNYSDDAGPRTCFLCSGRTGLASGLSGCCWLASPGCESCVWTSSCGSKDQIHFVKVLHQTTVSIHFCSLFPTSLFSEEMDRVFVCDSHEMERCFQFHVLATLIPDATETLFASHACWHHSQRFQSDVPEKREVVWVDDFENVQQCYGPVLFGDSIILLQ